MNIPTLRNWQKEAIGSLETEWEINNNAKPLIAACPGSGKTLMAGVAAINKLKDEDVSLILVVSPTVNIKAQWKDTLIKLGITAFDGASNEAMRFRLARNDRLVGGYQAICVTYAQLSQDRDLFVELAKRESVLLIADEIHHADDSEAYGIAIEAVSEKVKLRLALSGTPFNSSGGALAMCPSEERINQEGRLIRKTLPLYSYSYSKALSDLSCRPVEFIKMYGIGVSTYKSLANNDTFQRVIDLSKQNKTDSIGALLATDGEFLKEMLKEGLRALEDIKRHDIRAGMLIVAKDKDHGARIAKLVTQFCHSKSEWRNYTSLEVYNDTDNAHKRISELDNDRTDIVITVRMISEGVDVKRLRVGVYATDYRTRMFFMQFVGRFVRWESRLDGAQHGRIIIPAHIDLLAFAREIEIMVDEALIASLAQPPTLPSSPKNEYLGTTTEKTSDGVIFRGNEFNERDLAELFFSTHPSLRGVLTEAQGIKAAKESNMKGASITSSQTNQTATAVTDWWDKNNQLVRAVVRLMKLNGDDDNKNYMKVNYTANKRVGIPRVDKLTDPSIMQKRHKFLQEWLTGLTTGNPQVFSDDD